MMLALSLLYLVVALFFFASFFSLACIEFAHESVFQTMYRWFWFTLLCLLWPVMLWGLWFGLSRPFRNKGRNW